MKVMGRAAPEAPTMGDNTSDKWETAGTVNLRWFLVCLAEVQGTLDCQEDPRAHGDNFTADWLVQG